MPEPIEGESVPAIDRNAELAALRADVSKQETEARSAMEAQGQSPEQTADTKTQAQTENPSPENPEGKDNQNLSQPKGKSGDVSEEQIQKDTEHLKADLAKKEARKAELLQQYKDLQRQYTPVAQEVKKLEKEVQTQAPSQNGDRVDIPIDFRKKFTEDLEKDPVEAIVKLASVIADGRLDGFRRETGIDKFRENMEDQKRDRELDSLAKEGHTWIHEEGLERFVDVFKERPYLLNSPTPFRDATRFMEGLPSKSNGQSPAQGPRTPTLSSSGSLPPPTSPADTLESSYASLDSQYDRAIKRGDIREAKKIMGKMGSLLNQR
jgi:hypothetical protein